MIKAWNQLSRSGQETLNPLSSLPAKRTSYWITPEKWVIEANLTFSRPRGASGLRISESCFAITT